MDLLDFHMKHLLQEEIVIIFEKEFPFSIAKHEVDPQSLIHDQLAIAIVNSDLVTVGHISKLMSTLTYFFLKHSVHIKCKTTGVKKYSKDFEQSALKIRARLKISSAKKRMTDVIKKTESTCSGVQKN